MPRQTARNHGHDIVALRKAGCVLAARKPDVACRPDPSLRREPHRIDCLARPDPRLHLDKDGKVALADNEIDLPDLAARAHGDDPVAFQLQQYSGHVFRHATAPLGTPAADNAMVRTPHRPPPSAPEAAYRDPSWKDRSGGRLPPPPSMSAWTGTVPAAARRYRRHRE